MWNWEGSSKIFGRILEHPGHCGQRIYASWIKAECLQYPSICCRSSRSCALYSVSLHLSYDSFFGAERGAMVFWILFDKACRCDLVKEKTTQGLISPGLRIVCHRWQVPQWCTSCWATPWRVSSWLRRAPLLWVHPGPGVHEEGSWCQMLSGHIWERLLESCTLCFDSFEG